MAVEPLHRTASSLDSEAAETDTSSVKHPNSEHSTSDQPQAGAANDGPCGRSNSSAQSTSFAKGFGIPELSEMILNQLLRNDLMFRIQLTCKTLHLGVQSSMLIQRRFFRLPELLTKAKQLQVLPCKGVCNTYISVSIQRWKWRPIFAVPAYSLAGFLSPAKPHGAIFPFITQPPSKTIKIARYTMATVEPSISFRVRHGVTLAHVAIAAEILQVMLRYEIPRVANHDYSVQTTGNAYAEEEDKLFTLADGSFTDSWVPLFKSLYEYEAVSAANMHASMIHRALSSIGYTEADLGVGRAGE